LVIKSIGFTTLVSVSALKLHYHGLRLLSGWSMSLWVCLTYALSLWHVTRQFRRFWRYTIFRRVYV